MKKNDPWLLVSVLALMAGLGCNRDQVQSAAIEKTSPPVPPANALPPAPQPAQSLQWELPKGWSSVPASGMRYATLRPSATGSTEVSVVVLTGNAGGELANVNRWRAQLGLAAISEADLAPARKVVKAKAGEVAVFEFSHGGNRMVVGLLPTPGGDTWFLKLVGEDTPVTQAKTDFMKLLGTLSLG